MRRPHWYGSKMRLGTTQQVLAVHIVRHLDADSQRSLMERPTLTLPPLRGGSLPLPQAGEGQLTWPITLRIWQSAVEFR